MHNWLHIGRKWEAVPDINGTIVGSYSMAWWAWWKHLKPEGLKTCLSRDASHGTYDWGATWKGSQNGFYIVVLALGWWFLGAHNNNGHGINGCERALDEVLWTLDQMIVSDGQSLGKRTHNHIDADAASLDMNRGKKKYAFTSHIVNFCTHYILFLQHPGDRKCQYYNTAVYSFLIILGLMAL